MMLLGVEMVLLLTAVVLQAWAAWLAAVQMQQAGRYRLGWGCLSLALLLMIERRLFPLLERLGLLLASPPPFPGAPPSLPPGDLPHTLVGLLISILMVAGMLGLRRLFVHLQEQRRQLRELATTDALTGLANRRHFLQLAEQEFARAERSGQPLAVLMLDLDHFKRVNDNHGHATGDRVLQALGELCRRELRLGMDRVGRLGGEEFAVLLPETNATRALAVAERLRQQLAELALRDDHGGMLRVTMSLGLCCIEPALDLPQTSVATCLRRADEALYAAKGGGRNRVASWQRPRLAESPPV